MQMASCFVNNISHNSPKDSNRTDVADRVEDEKKIKVERKIKGGINQTQNMGWVESRRVRIRPENVRGLCSVPTVCC